MSVKITVKEYFATFQSPLHHEFCVVVDWVKFTRRPNPLTVHIRTHKIASVVAHNHTIWVLHWYDFEHKGVSQKTSLLVVAD